MRSWKFWLGLVLSVFFFWLAARNIDVGLFLSSLATIKSWAVVLAMAIVVATLMIRGVRWRYLLLPVKPIRFPQLFWSTTIGFAVNNVLPARLGEFARAYSLARRETIAFGASFGSIVVERLYDSFAVLFLFTGILFAFDLDLSRVIPVSEGRVALVLAVGGAGLLAAILALKWKTYAAVAWLGFLLKPLPPRAGKFVIGLFTSFVRGLTQSTRPSHVAIIVVTSIAIWVVSAFNMYYAVYAFDVELSFRAVVVLIMAVAVAVAVPAAPGYVGVYHYLAQQALVKYAGVEETLALSIAVIIHATNYLPQTVLGLARFAYEGLSVKQIEAAKERIED
ncbi:flippase-like domain-containing protein [bacterium]|nr:flippase-like domain-containing protein [bacterium]